MGHSMGGLVIKKAFILSQDVEEFSDRIRCIFFLGTPHHGADYAAILNNILTISGVLSPRDYIRDLTTGSTSAELINVEFGKYAHDLPIFTFFETLRVSLGFGISTGLIVDRRSAVLGTNLICAPSCWMQLKCGHHGVTVAYGAMGISAHTIPPS